MKYYMLMQKKERGCPMYFIDWALHDKYYPPKEADKIADRGYGYPWYKSRSEIDISGANVLIVKQYKVYEADIRDLLYEDIFLVSEAFLDFLKGFSVEFEQCKPVAVRSRKNEPISTKNYYAIIFKETPFFDIADQEGSEISPYDGFHFDRLRRRIVKLKFREDFDGDFFKFAPYVINTYCEGLFCSERFKIAAEKARFNGLDFRDIETIDWRRADRIIEKI